MTFGVKLQLPMEETSTKILFTSDSTQHQKTLGDAMVSVARRFKGELLWLETAENAGLTNALVDDLKKRAYRELTIVKKSGDFWSIAAKTSKEFKVGMTVIAAASKSGSMLGGGMSGCIRKFETPVIYLNPDSVWVEPKNILMVLDSTSESRQKFYRVSLLAKAYFAKVHVFAVSDKKDNETVRYLHAYSSQAFDYMVKHGVSVTELDIAAGRDMKEAIFSALSTQDDCWVATMNETDGTRFMKTSPFQHLCNDTKGPLMACAVQEVIGMGGSGY
ncbi:MAG: hypothetical protein FJ333_04290 [Sphingomonadales bacterium]|nr:hypothetical protein [Sphingomonadales bacterium]